MAWIAVLTAAGALLAAVVLVRILGSLGGPEIRLLEVDAPGIQAEQLSQDSARIDEVVRWLAAPERGGRDTPSQGLRDAQDYVAAAFETLGLEPAADAETLWREANDGILRAQGQPDARGVLDGEGPRTWRPFLRPFLAKSVGLDNVPLEGPSPSCLLRVTGADPFVSGRDFTPLAGQLDDGDEFDGSAAGNLAFAGYGIDNEPSGYDDFAGLDLSGKIAVCLGGEPEFDGPGGEAFGGQAITAEASIWNKADALEREGAVGAIFIRSALEDAPAGQAPFRSTRATWVPPTFDKVRGRLPTLEVSRSAAARILGVHPSLLEAEIRSSAAPLGPARRRELEAHSCLGSPATMIARTERRPELLSNVVGFLRGSEPAAPCIIVGAHLDHVGIGPRGRVGYGADDNASGVAALLLAAEILTENPPPYSVLFCAFTGEEDGLLGSRALAVRLPTGTGPVAAMINLDMVGRGESNGLAVLRGAPGGGKSAALDAAIEQAAASPGHGIQRVQLVHEPSFFTRSDHYSFYEVGIPSVFLFEGWPHQVGIYHTWRDTPETLDMEKIARTARLAVALSATLAQ